ncbi:hypothetical protein [Megasphaera sp.]|uniref:hypothetical protein n=1 Tax=Megasphaera sp. TaxID=2023260 RepID=UPI0025804533|nr:hypothetical protein [Megasphaera sp.]
MTNEGIRQILLFCLLQKLYMFLNIKHQTSNIKHQTSNIKHQTSNIKHQTSNIKHQTYYNGFPAKKEAALLSGGDRAASAINGLGI